MKPHVRTLLAQVDSPIFVFKEEPFWPHGDYQVPADFKVWILFKSSYAWQVKFIAPPWMLLAHPDNFPEWSERWYTEELNLAPMR
jgi:hypothetical protein